MSEEHAELLCETCGRETEHELHYAGRLLESSRCTVCGAHLDVRGRDMVPTYLADLEHRVVSKPGRLLRRAAHDPVGFAWSLPRAVLRQPGKLLAELRSVARR